MVRLPVFATVVQIYSFVIGRFGTIMRLTWVPAVCSLGVQITAAFLLSLGLAQPLAMLLGLVVQLASLVFGAMIAVAVHRLALFNEAPQGPAPIRFGRDVTQFVLASAVMILGASLLFAFLSTPVLLASGYQPPADGVFRLQEVPPIGQGLLALIGVAIAYIATRFSLVFPRVVAEQEVGFRAAWGMSAPVGWRLLGIVLLTIVPLLLANLALNALGAAIGSPALSGAITAEEFRLTNPSFWVFLVYLFCLTVALSAVGAAALSFPYKILRGQA